MLGGAQFALPDAVEWLRTVAKADWLSPDEIVAAKKALLEHLRGERSARYLM